MRHMRLVPLLAVAIGLAACSGAHEADNTASSNEIGAVDEPLPANDALPVDNATVAAENTLDAKSAGAGFPDGTAADPLGNAGEAATNAL